MQPEYRGVVSVTFLLTFNFVFMEKFKKLSRGEMKKVVGGVNCQCFQYCANPGGMCFSGANQGVCVSEICPIGNPCLHNYCSFN